MSKCDVQIMFDRPDRTYRGGEPVTGRVLVEVNQDVNSHGVVLEHFWQTHGSGNTAAGDKDVHQLYSGPLQAGQSLELPFHVEAPHGPPTYHGHHLNIDHYLRARVDIPWAFDPKAEEEYLLAPSGEPYGELPSDAGHMTAKGCQRAGVLVGATLVVVGVLFLIPVGLIAIPVGLLMLFYAYRKRLAEKRLGEVRVDWGPEVIAPGSRLPVRVSFSPTKAVQSNSIRLKLSAREVCVSGSGTNSTTYRHPLHEETVRISGPQLLAAQQAQDFAVEVAIPDMPAYTFHASDNQLEWTAELTIDLPMWPNWVDTRHLVVRATPEYVAAEEAAFATEPIHASEVTGEQPAEDKKRFSNSSGEPYAVASEWPYGAAGEMLEPTVAPQTDGPAAEPATAKVALSPLGKVLEAIAAESRYSQGRERIVERHAGENFTCSMTVRRTERTYEYDAREPYRDGRTVHGTLAGTEHDVVVQMKSSRNDEVDRLRSGDSFECEATPIKWNSVYDRLELREV